MPLTFDISSRLRPVIVREVEMYDNHSVASGSDCSSSQTSIKIRILPRSTAWNSAPEREDDPWTPRSVAQPAKRGVLSVQIRRQSDDQQQPSKQQKVCGQVAADGGRKRRHISVRRLAFNCLSAKSASVDHYDVADCGAEQPSDDVTLRSPQFTATKVVSRSAGFSFRGENVRHSIGNGLPSSPPSSAAASIDLRHSDVGQQQVAVGQQFSVNFSTTAVLPAVRRQEDDCLCAAAAASSPPVPSSSAIIRHHCQVPMSRTAADTTVARTPGTRHQAQSQQPHPAGSYHLARQQSANHPVTSASGQRHRSSVAAPTSSGNSLVTRRTITDFEAAELSGYQHVYYIGDAACDRKWAVSESGKTDVLINNGLYYDDADGFYNFVPHDHIAYRYEIFRLLGRGSFGEVVRAFDHRERRWVALKIIRCEERFRRQAAEEVRMLQLLNRTDADGRCHVVRMLDHFDFRRHTCIVFEPLGIDLYEALRRRRFRGFPLGAARRAVKGIVTCLALLRRQGIIHCDLKPENILLTIPSPGQQQASRPVSVKVIDFGSSCFETDKLFVYVQSRFYRAPEVILGAGYGPSVDMWSLGCIVAELVTGRPLFTGEDEADQLASQMEYLGMPPDRLLSRSRRAAQFISSSGRPRYCSVMTTNESTPGGGVQLTGSTNRSGVYRGPPGSRNLTKSLLDINGRQSEVVTRRHQDYVHFVRGCLEWDSAQRMTPDEAMHHVWLQPAADQNVRMKSTSAAPSRPSAVRQSSIDSFSDENLL